MALTKAKLMELIDNGDIDVGGGGFSPNLLHNWDFRNPVNQRGVSGAISTGTYFYDRWIRNSGTVTTNAAYLAIGASAVIEQRVEGNLLAGKTVTAGVMVGDAVYSGAGVMPASAGTASVTLTGWGTAVLGYATGYMYLRLSPTASSNVQAVKLELGTVSTLAYEPPMDRAVEWAKCRRYFKNNFRQMGKGAYVTSGQILMVLTFENEFRINPTLAIPSYEKLLVCPVVAEYTPSSHSVVVLSKHYTIITFSGTFTGANYGVTYAATTAASLMSLSADL